MLLQPVHVGVEYDDFASLSLNPCPLLMVDYSTSLHCAHFLPETVEVSSWPRTQPGLDIDINFVVFTLPGST